MDLQIGKFYKINRGMQRLLVIVLEQWEDENYFSMKDKYYKAYVVSTGEIIILSKGYIELNCLSLNIQALSPAWSKGALWN